MANSNLQSLEGVIRSKLKSLGYFNIEIQNEHERSFNVLADGSLRKIFLKVTVYLGKEHIKALTLDQISNIKQTANSLSKEPWAAYMKVNENGELVEDIRWTNLAKHSA